jgi:CDP-glycerol glycerophosphotransferase
MKNKKVNKLFAWILILFTYPFYVLSIFFPKKDNVWTFGTSNGKKYNENSRALFEYISKEKSEIRAVWLTGERSIKEYVTKKGFEAHTFYSVKGIYIALIAKVLVISTSYYDIGFIPYIFRKKIKIIQLWHGTPLKILTEKFFGKIKKTVIDTFRIYLGRPSDIIISATSKNTPIYKSLGHPKTKVTGQPRNDILFNKLRRNSSKKNILYMPTYRGYDKEFDFFSKYKFNGKEINSFLIKSNATLWIKLHPCDEKRNLKKINSFSNIKKIRLSNFTDIYKILQKMDILITDYSSIYFDFLLLDRPIIFAPFDLEKYKKTTGMYYNYDIVTPGPKVKNWEEIQKALKDILNKEDKYTKQRAKINKMFNKYSDKLSSDRIYSEILKLIKKERNINDPIKT